jgi:carboxyl-terminal processing protease
MQKKFISLIIVVAILAGTFYAGTYVGGIQSEAAAPSLNISNLENGKPENVDFSLFWKAWQTLNEKYVSTATSTDKKGTNQDRVYGAIKGMTEALGDPYTSFFPPAESKMFESEISGNFEGVGMELGIKDNVLTVVSALKGTPASKAGIRAGDKIIKINDTLTSDVTVDQAIKLIRGPKGTPVSFGIVREGEDRPVEVKVVRDVINIPTLETEKKPNGVFVIRLYSFTAQSPNLFRGALREFVLSGSDKLILDLRDNPGGYLDAAVDMASWFLPNGKVIVRENFGAGKEEIVTRSRGYDLFSDKLKFAILINGGSASASEILAGALDEYDRARVVGTNSFGKGSVQELIKLTPDTALKVTVARWLTPNGQSISEGGLKPEFVVNITEDDIKNGKDPQMDKAIEILSQ